MLKTKSGKPFESIDCTERAFPEFPQLLFGETDNGSQYFDATLYLKTKGLTDYDPEQFLSAYFHPIRALVTAYELDDSKIAIRNQDGHLLIDSSLVYLFLSYTNPHFLAHLNDRISELFKKGFCVSDSFLYHSAKSRLTPEVLLQSVGSDGRGAE